jgi:hypothetical protein
MSFSKILALTGVDFGIQWVCWGVAALFKTEKFYDLAGMYAAKLILHLLNVVITI